MMRVRMLRRVLLVAMHIVAICATYYMAYWLRFDGNIAPRYFSIFTHTLPILIMLSVLVFAMLRAYRGMWSFFSIDDLVQLGFAQFVTIALFALTIFAMKGWSFDAYPRSILLMTYGLLIAWIGGTRLVARYIREFALRESGGKDAKGDRVLIVGDFSNVDLVLRGARGAGIGRFVGIANDEGGHESQQFRGIKLFYARRHEIGAVAKQTRADSVLILPPFNRPQEINGIVESCADEEVACTFRTIPSILALASGELTASSIRSVDIEDLLPREAAHMDRTEVRRFIKGKKVMITGAGGSIGSELCRQVASYEPAMMVLFEFSEFALYTIEQDLSLRYPNLRIVPVAGDVRHSEEITAAIRGCDGIDVIYHAAAYKHVPLMEQNVPACFRTNVLGTARLAEVAVAEGVERVVMISSDKAVRPTSVMGATKRIAERVVSEMPTGDTSFVAVRFGNVLESSGSVIPLFKRLIAEGKPLPVTSAEVRRFFMTIREAVDLVMQAGTVGQNGDVMVLEMGESVKIIDLARRLIELSGLIPDKDIKIEIVGMRPGEKEYEEVMTSEENVIRTAYEKIWVLRKTGTPPPIPSPAGPEELQRIEQVVVAHDEAALRAMASQYVPENAFPSKQVDATADALTVLPFPAAASSVSAQVLGKVGA
jgi:FlaA1/EpsC-like NDP-sugar epimerase